MRLQGPSGRGKNDLGHALGGAVTAQDATASANAVQCEWDPLIPASKRCGVLFQQTALQDKSTVAGNLAVALSAAGEALVAKLGQRDLRIKQLLNAVGLDYKRDAGKRPTELSGGMARRAGTVLQLAQNKHVIVLDEPFTGLGHETARSVTKSLLHLRRTTHTALVLISHKPDIARTVLGAECYHGNLIVALTEPPLIQSDNQQHDGHPHEGSAKVEQNRLAGQSEALRRGFGKLVATMQAPKTIWGWERQPRLCCTRP